MADDSVSATRVINAPAGVIFAVLADPASHAVIDGTGWVRETLDDLPLTVPGQIFRMAMYHPNHPDGDYQVANRIQVLDAPNTISWEPGNVADDGTLRFDGWIWRYDLTPDGPGNTTVILTYDWSSVPDPVREHIGFRHSHRSTFATRSPILLNWFLRSISDSDVSSTSSRLRRRPLRYEVGNGGEVSSGHAAGVVDDRAPADAGRGVRCIWPGCRCVPDMVEAGPSRRSGHLRGRLIPLWGFLSVGEVLCSRR
jgi:hypothetical protein